MIGRNFLFFSSNKPYDAIHKSVFFVINSGLNLITGYAMIILKKIWYFYRISWEIFTRLFQDHCRKNIFDVPNLGVWAIKKNNSGGAPAFYFSLCFTWGERQNFTLKMFFDM
jgi:hypothetical protein